MKTLALYLVSSILIISVPSFAGDEVINQLRFFYGQSSVDAKEVNTVTEAAGLKNFSKLDHFGFEASRDVAKFFNLGLRFSVATSRSKMADSSASSEYDSNLGQVILMPMLNFPFVNTEKFKLDIFAGVGLANTTLKLKTSDQNGTYSSNQSSPSAVAGLSFAVGHKYVFLKVEGGYQYSKPSGFTKNGTLTGSIDTIDLSGSYFNVGIYIDGLKLGKL